MPVEKVAIASKLRLFADHWHPRIVGQINDVHVKLVKLQGEFDWHFHEAEDELFLVLSGVLVMNLREDGRERAVTVEPGEFIIIPHGLEHKPVAPAECAIMLIEPAGTLNTGNVETGHTVRDLEWI